MRHIPTPTEPRLGLAGLNFRDLFRAEGLQRLDDEFLARLNAHDPVRRAALLAYRVDSKTLSALELSELLLACAPPLDDFIAELFGIEAEIAALRAATRAHDPVFAFKKQFVQKRAKRRLLAEEDIETSRPRSVARWELARATPPTDDRELAVARYADDLLADAERNKDAIEQLALVHPRAHYADGSRVRGRLGELSLAAAAAPSAVGAVERARQRSTQARARPAGARAPARRFRAHRYAHVGARGAERG